MRDLTPLERELLDFMLTAEFAGVEQLREQAQTARLIESDNGELRLSVDPAAARPISLSGYRCVSTATSRYPLLYDCTHLNLWTHDGLLHSLDVSWLETAPVEFPPAAMWEHPTAEYP